MSEASSNEDTSSTKKADNVAADEETSERPKTDLVSHIYSLQILLIMTLPKKKYFNF